jgi:hypothetical protein
MSTARFSSGSPSTPLWQVLCEDALLEFDNAKLHKRILHARSAIYDREQEILTDPSERHRLDNALRSLQALEENGSWKQPHRKCPWVVPSVSERLMGHPQQEIACSFCKKSVIVRQEFYVDENGEAVHTRCYEKFPERQSSGSEQCCLTFEPPRSSFQSLCCIFGLHPSRPASATGLATFNEKRPNSD